MARLTRREFLGWIAASAAPGFLAACARESRNSVSLLNWAGYIGKDTLARFEKQSGVTVTYDIYASEERMLAKLEAGRGAYDVVVAPDHMIPKLKERGLIARLPRERVSGLERIGARFRGLAHDPGLDYSVPYLWGTTGLGFYKPKFPRAPRSWRALWRPELGGRLSMLDDAREVIQCALLVLGLPLDTGDAGHLAQARELLEQQKPLLKEYGSSTYPDQLASGELWLAQAWSGDVLQADGGRVDFAIPDEGAVMWVDNLCVVAGAESNEAAWRLLDYLLRADVAADISTAVRYATPNEKALPLVAAGVRADPRVYPPPETLQRLRFAPPLSAAAEALWAKTWEGLRS